MSQALGDTDLDALAAEYVLGTLGADERTHAQALLTIDDGFAVKVRTWERRLGELHLMVEPVDPDAKIWERIKAKAPTTAQGPIVSRAEPPASEVATAPAAGTTAPAADAIAAPAVAAPPAEPAAADHAKMPSDTPALSVSSAAATPPVPVAATSEVVPVASVTPAPVPMPPPKPAPVTAAAAPFPSAPRAPLVVSDERERVMRRRVRRWRAFATLMTLVVLALGGLGAAWRFAPEHVPPMLQPIAALRAVGIAVDTGPPPRPPAPPESQYDE